MATKMSRVCGLAVLAGLALLSGVSAVPAAASYPGAPGPIVYPRYTGTGEQLDNEGMVLGGGLFTHSPHRTGGGKELTSSPSDNSPSFSADGRQIAFTRGPERGEGRPEPVNIFVANADGTAARQLTFGEFLDRDPSFSPDGREVIFDRRNKADGNEEILEVGLEGGPPRTLAQGLDGFESGLRPEPVFTPNGAWIFYVDLQQRGSPDQNSGIFAMRPNGSDRHAVIAGPDEDLEPDTSPDGRELVFISNRPTTLKRQLASNVFTAKTNGRGVRQLTRNPYRGVEFADPCWAPDGKHIALLNARSGEEELLVLAVDKTKPISFFGHGGVFLGAPSWGTVPAK